MLARRLSVLALGAALATAGPAFAEKHVVVKRIALADSGGPRLGVQIVSLTDELRQFFGAPTGAGVLVSKVAPDSAGARAGIKVGDVITDVGGAKVDDAMDIIKKLASKKNGEDVLVGVVRDKKKLALTAKVERKPGEMTKVEDDGDGDGEVGGYAYDFDFDNLPGAKVMHKMIRIGGDDLGKLEKRLDKLDKRLEELEKATKK